MKRYFFTAVMFAAGMQLYAQPKVVTNPLYTNPKADVTIPYRWDDEGKSLPIEWGFDTAWLSEGNVVKGINYVGKELIDLIRVSFRVNAPLIDDTTLPDTVAAYVTQRLNIARKAGLNVNLAINCDQEAGINNWYHGTKSGLFSYTYHPERWVQNIKEHIKLFEAKGNKVVTVSPFNEPDYGWNQGTTNSSTKEEMRLICQAMKQDEFFDGRRISGGNTLNCDEASPWYNYMKEFLDEGNTHQLAGEFNTYANFFAEVRADDKHATADELHNIMEAFVGAEYGMQTGIWWGSAERARAELMKASRGTRIGYGEGRNTWMAGAVYRHTDNRVQAFIGQSERQAATTTFAFRSDRPVFYDGKGPLREFYTSVTGGTGYQKGTTNGERVYDVTTGEDIAPVIDGTYYIVNRANGHRLLSVSSNARGTQLALANYNGKTSQQWEIHPCPDTRGGDYSYHNFTHVASGYAPDVENWSLSSGTKIMLWDNSASGCQTYWLEYAGDGYFFIRNQNSSMCMQPASTTAGSLVSQKPFNSKTISQQWRLIPVSVAPEFVAPTAPTGLILTPQSASIRLDWDAIEGDATLVGYNLLRSTNAEEGYEMIARGLTTTAFVDHEVKPGVTYYYKVKATDTSLNTSEASNVVNGQMEDKHCIIASWGLDDTDSLYDATENRNDMVTIIKPTFTTGKIGKALFFNGSSQFAQLPYGIATYPELTFCAWVKWTGGGNWQRIFDFGNDDSHYMFLTPSNGSEMVFGIKNGGEEEKLTCTTLATSKWVHVAVTISNDALTLYVNGVPVASSSTINIRPYDIAPTFNYLGRSQFNNDPLFKGYMDDVRLYNYALSADKVAAIADLTDGINKVNSTSSENKSYDLDGRRITTPRHGQVFIQNGNKYIK